MLFSGISNYAPIKKSPGDIDRLIDVDHDDAVLRTFILFVQTAREVLKYANAHLYRKTRLSIIKLIVLLVLASNNGVMAPSEIAEWTQTEPHSVTTLVKRMRQDGLVTTERNSRDERFINIILTDKGRDVLSQAMPVAREVVDQVMLSIAKGDAAQLENTLRVLRQNTHYNLKGFANRSQPQPS